MNQPSQVVTFNLELDSYKHQRGKHFDDKMLPKQKSQAYSKLECICMLKVYYK